MKVNLFTLILIAFVTAGCATIEITPQLPGGLVGYVYIQEGVGAASTGESAIIVSGEVMNDPNYKPLTGAKATLSGSSPVYTNSSGRFSIDGISPGWKSLTIDHDNIRPVRQSVIIQSGKTTYLTNQNSIDAGIGWYLIIGIERYGHLAYPQYSSMGADKDATSIWDELFLRNDLAGMGKLLINSEATKKEIKDWIQYANTHSKPNDYLVVYYAGLTLEHIRKDEVYYPTTGGLHHILPYDAQLSNNSDLDRTLISDGELELWLSDFKGQDVTVILEASYSGTFIDGNSTFPLLPFALRRAGYTVITATDSDTKATYDPHLGDSGQSVFTHFLVHGLQTINTDDGKITANQLYVHVRDEMASYFGTAPDRHVPQLYVGHSRSPVVYRY